MLTVSLILKLHQVFSISLMRNSIRMHLQNHSLVNSTKTLISFKLSRDVKNLVMSTLFDKTDRSLTWTNNRLKMLLMTRWTILINNNQNYLDLRVRFRLVIATTNMINQKVVCKMQETSYYRNHGNFRNRKIVASELKLKMNTRISNSLSRKQVITISFQQRT